ncbi:MAG: phosphotriesterase family protein [Armatimonadota bacterium]
MTLAVSIAAVLAANTTSLDAASAPKLRTVTGDVKPPSGIILPHEHALCDFAGPEKAGRANYSVDKVIERLEAPLKALRQAGVVAMMDCTPIGIGRDPEVLRELSKRTGLLILTNTGLYREPLRPSWGREKSEAELEAWMVDEITKGIDGTGIRAGFIKLACSDGGPDAVEQKILRASARAAKRTGVCIASHTNSPSAALSQIDVLASEKFDLSRFIVVHTDSLPNFEDHLRIAERGAVVEYDAINPSNADRYIPWIRTLIDRGYGDRILLSQDVVGFSAGQPYDGPVPDYTFLVNGFIPKLKEAGISDKWMRALTVENPTRVFGLTAKK